MTEPLFGRLGQGWRVRRAGAGALATAAALCLEPLGRIPAGDAIRFRAVWAAEAAARLALALYVVAATRRASR